MTTLTSATAGSLWSSTCCGGTCIFTGLEVTYISNITDIDDRIIERSAERGIETTELTATYEAAWWESMDALGVLRPDGTPHATAFVTRMVDLVADLVARGAAYETADGVYLSVMDIPGYGLLAHQPLDSLRAGARVEADDEKRSPLDFVLWKKAKPGEPTWESPWGPGRPGWHTECVVMSLDLLGDGFDLHGGAIDLIFPHHENERAQAVATGRTFATPLGTQRLGHRRRREDVQVAGQLHLARRSAGRTDARAYRLVGAPVALPLTHRGHPGHRRRRRSGPHPSGRAGPPLRPSRPPGRRTGCRPGVYRLGRRPLAGGADRADGLDPEAVVRFRRSMDDDLDTPGALAAVFDLVRSANVAADAGDTAAAQRDCEDCRLPVRGARASTGRRVGGGAGPGHRRPGTAAGPGQGFRRLGHGGLVAQRIGSCGLGGRGRPRRDPDTPALTVDERYVNRRSQASPPVDLRERTASVRRAERPFGRWLRVRPCEGGSSEHSPAGTVCARRVWRKGECHRGFRNSQVVQR